MEIILGKTAGFCYGVKRAIEETEKETLNNKEIYCLGEIVHNKSVVQELENKGIKFIDNIKQAKGKTIIRAHGEKKETYKELAKRGIEIKDLTCPNVIKTHDIAEEYKNKNYFIVLIGIKNHPESIATLSFCGENSILLQEQEELGKVLEAIKTSKKNNILIMAQTTYNSKKFDDISKEITNKLIGKNIEIRKTICGATEVRQKETIEISKNVDAMIIVGDKKSSNTNKLYDISKEYCSKVIFAENDTELNVEDLKNISKIGIMAGASTPNQDIEKIIKVLRSI